MSDPWAADAGSPDGSPKKRGRGIWSYLVAICLLIVLALAASSNPGLTSKATSILAAALPTIQPAKTTTATTPTATGKTGATPTPAAQVLIVANTDGDGVAVRKTPGSTERLSAWLEGTRMLVVGPDQQAGGRLWRNVRDPNGVVGWVPSEYLAAPAPATPPPAATPTTGSWLSEPVTSGNKSLVVGELEFFPQIGGSAPGPGREYVVMTVTIRNVGDKRESYAPADFRLQNGEGNITGSKMVVGISNQLEQGQLAPGGRVTGRLVFEVPQRDRNLILLWPSCTPACDERQIRLK